MTRLPRPIFRKPDPTVDHDLACIKCSYNLRGLTQFSHCPECHTPVQDSLDSLPDHPLDRADAAYLAAITRALPFLPIALTAACLAPLVALPGPVGSQRPYDVSPTLFFTDLLARTLICLAIFPLTRREPGPSAPEHPKVPATILRTAAVAILIAPVLDRLISPRFPGLLTLPFTMVALLTLLATPLCYWFLSKIAKRLLARRPRRTLTIELNTLVLAGPMLFLVSMCFRTEPGYASFPHLAFAYPADDVAHLRLRPITAPYTSVPYASVLMHLWVLSVLLHLWLAVRAVRRSPQ